MIKEKVDMVNELVVQKDLCIPEAIMEITDDLDLQNKIASQFEVLVSFYLIGSEGWVNLFYREKGAEYYDKRIDDFDYEPYGGYILQWEGARDYHSGYDDSGGGKNLKEAFDFFQQRMKEASSNHRARRSI